MTIGTSLFHAQAGARFSAIGAEIAGLQAQISAGKADPRPSADPVRALNLSAAQEQGARLERYAGNLDRAAGRLALADTALEAGVDIMQRVRELAVAASSDTMNLTARDAIRSELQGLRNGLVDVANARDETGLLFGGLTTRGVAFEQDANGVVYRGDQGQQQLRSSESGTVATGLPGPVLFGGIDDGTGGETDVFAVIGRFQEQLDAPQPGGMNDVMDSVVKAADHLADGRARIGAMAANVDRQSDAIEGRQVRLTETLSGLEDLDIAAVVTELNRTLLTREASQQSFVAIGRSSLFDYMR
ncbi:flagellin N-terminal helical domain-containing protein [Roseovarius sp.]|jgi:flagellar hook-associated protein 3 FlgL